jgi:hypothetical protein
MSEQIPGILEVDHDRGVIYFHRTDELGAPTLLRICSLRKPIPLETKLIDVVADSVFGSSYQSDPKFTDAFLVAREVREK